MQFTFLKSVQQCYRVDQTSTWSWENGRQRCESQGADLVTLQTSQETTAIKGFVASSKLNALSHKMIYQVHHEKMGFLTKWTICIYIHI